MPLTLTVHVPGLPGAPVVTVSPSTGNASADAPHLHFAIFELGPEKKWWEGTAIDPFPLLAATP